MNAAEVARISSQLRIGAFAVIISGFGVALYLLANDDVWQGRSELWGSAALIVSFLTAGSLILVAVERIPMVRPLVKMEVLASAGLLSMAVMAAYTIRLSEFVGNPSGFEAPIWALEAVGPGALLAYFAVGDKHRLLSPLTRLFGFALVLGGLGGDYYRLDGSNLNDLRVIASFADTFAFAVLVVTAARWRFGPSPVRANRILSTLFVGAGLVVIANGLWPRLEVLGSLGTYLELQSMASGGVICLLGLAISGALNPRLLRWGAVLVVMVSLVGTLGFIRAVGGAWLAYFVLFFIPAFSRALLLVALTYAIPSGRAGEDMLAPLTLAPPGAVAEPA